MSEINIDYSLNEAAHQMQLGGTIRIMIGDELLTVLSNNPADKPTGHIGSYVHRDLYNIIKACLKIKKGEVGIYEEEHAEIESTVLKFIFEPLNSEYMRVAFRQWDNVEYCEDLPETSAANGFPVVIDDFCQEAVSTARDLLDECQAMDLNTEESLLSSIQNQVNELDNLLEHDPGVLL